MSQAIRIFKNTGIVYLRITITAFITLYTTRLVLQKLGVDDFGIFTLLVGLAATFGFLSSAMVDVSQRFIAYAIGENVKNTISTVFNVSLALNLIVAFLMIFILEIVGYIFINYVLSIPNNKINSTYIIFQFTIIGIFFNILSIPYDAVLLARENIKFISLFTLLESVLRLIIAFIIQSYDSNILLVYGILTALITPVVLVLKIYYCGFSYSECLIIPTSLFDSSILKKMTNFGMWTLMGSASSLGANYGQSIVLNIFFGTSINTSQGVSGQLSGQLSVFTRGLMQVVTPLIARNEGMGNRDGVLKLTVMVSKVGYILLLILYIPILIEMPQFFSLWLNNVPEYSIIFCRLLLLRNLIDQLWSPLNSLISAVGDLKRYQIALTIVTLMPLPLCYILFQNGMNPVGLYVVFIIYSIAMMFVSIYYSSRLLNYKATSYINNVVVRCSSLLMINLFLVIPFVFYLPIGYVRISLIFFISLISITISSYFFAFNEEERITINTIAKNIQKKYKFFHYE